MKKNPIETGLVIISNLFPLYGLFYLGWSAFSTACIFLIETFIILFFFWARSILRAFNGIYSNLIPSIIIAIPVVVFSTVQLLLSTIMFGTGANSLMWNEIYSIIHLSVVSTLIGIILMILRELVDFIFFIVNKKYKVAEMTNAVSTYHSLAIRIFVMQFVVIIGGFVSKASGNVAMGVSLLVLINASINFHRYFGQKS